MFEKDLSVLGAHASGNTSIHALHSVCLVYIFTRLPLYSQPYTSNTVLIGYISEKVYLPIVIWILMLVYELMCIILERKRKDRLLIGHTDNGILSTIYRAFVFAIGIWFFYLGLGIGNYLLGWWALHQWFSYFSYFNSSFDKMSKL